MPSGNQISEPVRIFSASAIVLSAILLLIGGWTIPFKYESFSILYKFGTEKILLRTGKIIGITIALLVFFQVILASRFSLFEKIVSIKAAMQLHRRNGLLIAFLAVSHPLLIKASENFTPYTFEPKYYPEFLGIGLFCVVLTVSVTAFFRASLKISYPWWLRLHRAGATLVVIMLPMHVLWVSETFKQGLPRHAALVIFLLSFFCIVLLRLKRLSTARK